MSTIFRLAADKDATTWEDVSDLVNWETMAVGGSANRGEIFTANGIDLLDDAGIRDLPIRRIFEVIETATTPDTRLFRGRTVGTGKARGVIVTEPAKMFDINLVDHNSDFGGIGFAGKSQPAENDHVRVRSLLETYLQGQNRPSTDLLDTYLSSSTPVALPAHRYEGAQPIDWMNHIVESTGKQFFITVDSEIFYAPVTSTIYAADLSITDVIADVDDVDVFFPGNARANEDGSEFFSRIRRRISGGRVVSTVDDAAELANDRWGTAIVDEEVQSVLAATTRNNKFLAEFAHAQITYTCTLDLHETQVDKIKYGQTVSFRSAACGILTPETLRIGSLQWTKISADRYRANLELGYPTKFGKRAGGTGSSTPTPGPTPFIPDNDSEPSDDIVSIYENTTVVNPAQFDVPVSDTFSIIAGHPWRVTINFAAITNSGRVTINCDGAVQPLNEGVPGGGGAGLVHTWNPGALGTTATGCRVYINGDASQTMTTHATDAGKVEYTDGSGIGTPVLTPTVPYFGQQVIESLAGDGVADDFQTNHPYQQNSLLVFVGGINVIPTQVDPETGDFSLPFVPASGTEVVLVYVSSNGTDTGAGNDSTPPSVVPVIPLDFGESADITTQDYDDVADSGTSNEVARADHLHGMPSAGGGGSITVEDEGTPLSTAATTLDFVGAGVTASGTGATKTITIPGGGGGDPFDGKPYVWTPPGSAATEDDEFNDATGMSGPVNGLDAQWTKRNLGTASWLKLDDAVAPGCAYFDIPTGQASDQAIYQTVPAGDWTFAAHMHGHRSSDRQYWGVFCVSSAGTGILAVMDTGADTSNGLRTLTTWADGGAGTFHGEAAWNTDENGLNRNPSVPVTVTLRKASGVYHMGYSYSHRLLPGNYFEISHTPTAFTAAFIGVGRFGPGGTAGVSKVTIDFFRKVA
jgi:hypothetical protein